MLKFQHTRRALYVFDYVWRGLGQELSTCTWPTRLGSRPTLSSALALGVHHPCNLAYKYLTYPCLHLYHDRRESGVEHREATPPIKKARFNCRSKTLSHPPGFGSFPPKRRRVDRARVDKHAVSLTAFAAPQARPAQPPPASRLQPHSLAAASLAGPPASPAQPRRHAGAKRHTTSPG